MNSKSDYLSSSLPSEVRARSLDKRLLIDKLGRYVFTLGGWLILLSICAILFVILIEVIPLFKPVTYAQRESLTTVESPMSIYIDDHKEIGIGISNFGQAEQFQFTNQGVSDLKSLDDTELSAYFSRGNNDVYFGTTSGKIAPAEIKFSPKFSQGNRTIVPSISWQEPFPLNPKSQLSPKIQKLVVAETRSGTLIVGQISENQIWIHKRKESAGLMSDGTITVQTSEIAIPEGQITALALDKRGDFLLVGNDIGKVFAYELRASTSPVSTERYNISTSPITSIDYSLGGRTVVIGDANGVPTSWLFVNHPSVNSSLLEKINSFEQHSAPIEYISTSRRNKVFATADTLGNIKLHYTTSGETLASIPSTLRSNQEIATLKISPKGNGIFLATKDGSLYSWDINNPHPEISLKTLFAPVHYEGYSDENFVWQSSGGTDDFEPKLSLIPLLVGTLKGTLYALIFSVPLALLAAFYTSQFMSPKLKSIVKPALEIMAALPSVVIGFIAGLWLAPILEPHLVAVFCMPVCITIALVVTCLCVWKLKDRLGLEHKVGIELFIAIPVVLLALISAFPLSSWIETSFFAGNFNQWMYDNQGIRVDQRNSIIAGIAVGFAVIPIIFTIAEDCLSSVPKALSAGSLALGATRWQTSLRVIFPIAAPGIFAAIMIGLGRAVGETMIVLMATGNTPLIDLSAFTGFRALSANIAVELPEAPHGGTLYRVLFLTALILFIMTFLLNTISEFVRVRLRKKFGGV